MIIGIISDTHVSKDVNMFNMFLHNCFTEVDLILHLGDYTDSLIVENLKSFKNFVGVYGNADSDSLKIHLNEKEVLDIYNFRIGLYHGHGKGKTTMERVYEIFKDDKVDIIIFGHSHIPLIITKNKILFINPGSPNNKRKERWYSYVLLNLSENSISAEIKLFDSKYNL